MLDYVMQWSWVVVTSCAWLSECIRSLQNTVDWAAKTVSLARTVVTLIHEHVWSRIAACG
eukprot:20137-Eustigmatos_ZCMA.PRE.1